ncbi:hypothetical protein CRG98_009486 [Punica granatum]|uniref:Uncharacterized protein n=1 Tax=Punica granatum TaxID=22663 RepID=A0A2I0KNQ3_PUNGR|nr:hypothetical protein CRG98_009486 [Punica granatum]
MALARAALPHAHRVPRRNVQVEDDADQEDELPEEEEQPVPRREQKGVGNNLKLKIRQLKGTSSLKSTSSGSCVSIRCSNTVAETWLTNYAKSVRPEASDCWIYTLRVNLKNPHAVESEVEEAVKDVCGVTSKEKVEYADEGEKLKAQEVVSSESKLEKQRECLENIPKPTTTTTDEIVNWLCARVHRRSCLRQWWPIDEPPPQRSPPSLSSKKRERERGDLRCWRLSGANTDAGLVGVTSRLPATSPASVLTSVTPHF